MTEPEYRYVKGKGWVATTNPEPEVESLLAILKCGTRVWLLNRKPKQGERFGTYNNPTLEEWAKHCARFTWEEFIPYREVGYSGFKLTTMVAAP